MKKREFIPAYRRAAKAYHSKAPDFTAHMDALVKGCTDQQWNAVRIWSEQGYPEVDDNGMPIIQQRREDFHKEGGNG